jgi:hypothetical protein
MTAAKKAKLEQLGAVPGEQLELQVDEPALVKVKFRGQVFTIPKDMDDWKTKTVLAWSRAVESSRLADWVEVVERLLGAEQLARLGALAPDGDGDLPRRDMTEFLAVLINTVNTECAV